MLGLSEVGERLNIRSLQLTDNFYNEIYPSGTNAFTYNSDATRVAANTVF